MRKLFIQFYLLLMCCFLVMALLIGGIYRLTAERAMDKSLDDLMQGSLSFLRNELRHIPPEQWASKLEQTDTPLSFDIAIQSLSEAEAGVEPSAHQALLEGDIIMLEEQDRFLQRLPKSDYVMVVGPIPYLSFLRELRLFDYLLIAILGLSLAIPVFLWMRPHWRDLLRLESAAHQFGEGNLTVRSQLPADSGLRRLGAAFDHMAGKLQTLIASRKQLTDGIAHELRTPLVRLRYRLELLESLPDPIRQGIERDLSSLDGMIDEMLVYARLDRPEPKLQLATLEVHDWLLQRQQEWQLLSDSLDITVELPATSLRWHGDPLLLTRAVDNLIGNALRYATHHIRIRVEPDEQQARLCVEDDGPGIDPALYDQVFEPFIRLDPSRDRHTGGCGLGLAIVDAVMRAHGGRAELDHSRMGGALFTLVWPQSGPPPLQGRTQG